MKDFREIAKKAFYCKTILLKNVEKGEECFRELIRKYPDDGIIYGYSYTLATKNDILVVWQKDINAQNVLSEKVIRSDEKKLDAPDVSMNGLLTDCHLDLRHRNGEKFWDGFCEVLVVKILPMKPE